MYGSLSIYYKQMAEKNIRWIQRFGNFKNALMSFRRAIHLAGERPLNELEQQGLIQSFEYTHELAWKTLKDFLNHKGVQDLYGSKDTTRKAFKEGLIKNGTVWMEMIQCRNLTSHTYDQETAEMIIGNIRTTFNQEFEQLNKQLNQN